MENMDSENGNGIETACNRNQTNKNWSCLEGAIYNACCSRTFHFHKFKFVYFLIAAVCSSGDEFEEIIYT